MKLTPDDPRLSAYLLGELSRDEVAAVERAAASDPAVRLSLMEMENLTGFLGRTLGSDTGGNLKPSQREAVLRASREADRSGKIVELDSARRSWRPWATGIGAAAAVAFAAVLLSRLGGDGVGPADPSDLLAREVALLPLPGPEGDGGEVGVAAGGDAAGVQAVRLGENAGSYLGEVVRQIEKSALPDASSLPITSNLAGFSPSGELRLPVVVGTSSAIWVQRWIEEKQELPPKEAVRVEELVNSARLPTSTSSEGLKLGAEVVEWRGTKWLGIQIVAERDIVGLEIRSNSVSPRRVIGSFGRRSDSGLSTTLPAGRSTLVLLEFKDATSPLGDLEVRRDGVPEVFDLESAAVAGGPEMRHAVAMAAFGLWLRGELGDERLTSALEAAEESNRDAVREQTHQLIRRALALSEAGR